MSRLLLSAIWTPENESIISCTVLIEYSRQFINFFRVILDSKSPNNCFQIANCNTANILLIHASKFASRNGRTYFALGQFRNQIAKRVFCFKKSCRTCILIWLKLVISDLKNQEAAHFFGPKIGSEKSIFWPDVLLRHLFDLLMKYIDSTKRLRLKLTKNRLCEFSLVTSEKNCI